MALEKNAPLKEKKRVYKKPKLDQYGLIVRSTLGGSGTASEMGMVTSTMRHP